MYFHFSNPRFLPSCKFPKKSLSLRIIKIIKILSNQILIIPDVHGRNFWKNAVAQINNYQKVIFLGDYLDPYTHEGISSEQAIENFREIIQFKQSNIEKVVLLLGNHDVHYLWFREVKPSSRFCYEYIEQILDLFYDNQKFFKVAYSQEINDKTYLFTHAGISNNWLKYNEIELPKTSIDEYLNKMAKTIEGRKILAQVGQSRLGKFPSGGVVWADFDYDLKQGNENISDSIFQIIGHTYSQNLDRITPYAACLDCKKVWILDSKNGELQI